MWFLLVTSLGTQLPALAFAPLPYPGHQECLLAAQQIKNHNPRFDALCVTGPICEPSPAIPNQPPSPFHCLTGGNFPVG